MPDNSIENQLLKEAPVESADAAEIWKDVPNWTDFYQVSSAGRIKALRRQYFVRRGHKIVTIEYPEKILSDKVQNRHGHRPNVTLCRQGKHERVITSRLVLEVFIGSCPPGMEACHNDGNPHNNRLENLRWDTHIENCADRKKHGTEVSGSRQGLAVFKTPDYDIPRIHRLYNDGMTLKEIGDLYQANAVTILNILRGATYKQSQPNQEHRAKMRKSGMIGERHHKARVSESDVRSIREAIRNGEPPLSVAQRYSISRETVYDIKNRRSWRHIL